MPGHEAPREPVRRGIEREPEQAEDGEGREGEGRLTARQVMQQFVEMVLFGLVQDGSAVPPRPAAAGRRKKAAANPVA